MHTLACTAPQKVSCQIKLTSCLSWITTLFTEIPATHPYHSHTTMLVINTHPQIYPDSFSLEAEFSFASSYQLVTALSYGWGHVSPYSFYLRTPLGADLCRPCECCLTQTLGFHTCISPVVFRRPCFLGVLHSFWFLYCLRMTERSYRGSLAFIVL